jgi:hypothetical protein
MFGLPLWVLAAPAVALAAGVAGVVLWTNVLARVRSLWTAARYRGQRAVLGFLMGGSHPNTSRLLVAVVVATGALASIGVVGILVSQADTSASSGPLITTLFDLATNVWVWVLLLLVVFRSILFFSDRVIARATASITGFDYKSIRVLAEEAKQPDLERCERVLVQSGDTFAHIREWVLAGFDGEGHADPTFSPPEAQGDAAAGDDADATVADVPAPQSDPIDVDAADEHEAEDSDDADVWTSLRLFRLELASIVDLNAVLWKFITPAAITFVGLLLLVQLWVQWWAYPILAAVAAFVGGLYYWLTDLRHRRRLRALREDETPTAWTDLAILVKTVDVPETTMYYGFLDGNVYASTDRERLASTLANRALDRLEGYQPAPAIEEKNAYLLQRYVPLLDAWESERERSAIMDQLVNEVASAPEGMIPRDLLIEQVVEYDRRYVAKGLVFLGWGRDPDLVRAVYTDLVDAHAIVETPVDVTDPETGDTREVVAASLGDEPLLPNVAQLRGEFSSLFGKHAFDTRYSAPDTDAPQTPAPFVPPGERTVED